MAPYEPPVTYTGREGDETTRADALAVGERTLCVFLTWHGASAEHIRNGRLDCVRAVFTLDEGWDVG